MSDDKITSLSDYVGKLGDIKNSLMKQKTLAEEFAELSEDEKKDFNRQVVNDINRRIDIVSLVNKILPAEEDVTLENLFRACVVYANKTPQDFDEILPFGAGGDWPKMTEEDIDQAREEQIREFRLKEARKKRGE